MPSNFRRRELLRKLGRRLRLSGSGTDNSHTAPIALGGSAQAADTPYVLTPPVEAPPVPASPASASPVPASPGEAAPVAASLVADIPRSRLEHEVQRLFAPGLHPSPELSSNSSTLSFSEAPLPLLPTEAPADNVQITINVYYVQELGTPDPSLWQPRAADMTLERVPRGGIDPPTVSTTAEDGPVSTDPVYTPGELLRDLHGLIQGQNNVPTQTNNASSYVDAETQTNLLTLRVNPFNLVDLHSSSSDYGENLEDSSSSGDEVLPFSVSYAGGDVGEYSLW